jgi:hypothetical protein
LLRQKRLDSALQTANQQIRLYRNLMAATVVCLPLSPLPPLVTGRSARRSGFRSTYWQPFCSQSGSGGSGWASPTGHPRSKGIEEPAKGNVGHRRCGPRGSLSRTTQQRASSTLLSMQMSLPRLRGSSYCRAGMTPEQIAEVRLRRPETRSRR